ncbi:hypothetical protein VP01_1010g4 [Puccinia sorghi]|uniref:Uncharacterized protein n=1 Tax=Puccinia sorghi TaxID=27349 RepID=A0A0L6VVD7_9BASI|nr:hypothetical protein VP01_1010g4 [Puccinia sorghi]
MLPQISTPTEKKNERNDEAVQFQQCGNRLNVIVSFMLKAEILLAANCVSAKFARIPKKIKPVLVFHLNCFLINQKTVGQPINGVFSRPEVNFLHLCHKIQRTQFFPVITRIRIRSPFHLRTTPYSVPTGSQDNQSYQFSGGPITWLQRNNQHTQTQDPGLNPQITMAQHGHQKCIFSLEHPEALTWIPERLNSTGFEPETLEHPHWSRQLSSQVEHRFRASQLSLGENILNIWLTPDMNLSQCFKHPCQPLDIQDSIRSHHGDSAYESTERGRRNIDYNWSFKTLTQTQFNSKTLIFFIPYLTSEYPILLTRIYLSLPRKFQKPELLGPSDTRSAELNQVIKTYAKVLLDSKFPFDAEWFLVDYFFQSFYPHSQCDHNIKNEYQGHKMVTIADMSYDHLKTKHKSLSMNHIIFLLILHNLTDSYLKDDNRLTWEIHQFNLTCHECTSDQNPRSYQQCHGNSPCEQKLNRSGFGTHVQLEPSLGFSPFLRQQCKSKCCLNPSTPHTQLIKLNFSQQNWDFSPKFKLFRLLDKFTRTWNWGNLPLNSYKKNHKYSTQNLSTNPPPQGVLTKKILDRNKFSPGPINDPQMTSDYLLVLVFGLHMKILQPQLPLILMYQLTFLDWLVRLSTDHMWPTNLLSNLKTTLDLRQIKQLLFSLFLTRNCYSRTEEKQTIYNRKARRFYQEITTGPNHQYHHRQPGQELIDESHHIMAWCDDFDQSKFIGPKYDINSKYNCMVWSSGWIFQKDSPKNKTKKLRCHKYFLFLQLLVG